MVAYNSDNKGGELVVFETQSLRKIHRIPLGRVSAVPYFDGDRILAKSNRWIRVYSLDRQEPVLESPRSSEQFLFHGPSRTIIVTSDSNMHFLDADTLQDKNVPMQIPTNALSIAFSKDGSRVAWASYDRFLTIARLQPKSPFGVSDALPLKANNPDVRRVQQLDANRLLFTLFENRLGTQHQMLLDADREQFAWRRRRDRTELIRTALNEPSNNDATLADGIYLRRFDTATAAATDVHFTSQSGPIVGKEAWAYWDAQRRHLVVRSPRYTGPATIWNLDSGSSTLFDPVSLSTWPVFVPKPTAMLLLDHKGGQFTRTIQKFSLAAPPKMEVVTLDGQLSFHSAMPGPNSRWLSFCSTNGAICMPTDRIGDSNALLKFNVAGTVTETAISRDGRLAAVTADGEIRLFDIDSGRSSTPIHGPNHQGFPQQLRFSNDDRLLFSGTRNVQVFHAASGLPIGPEIDMGTCRGRFPTRFGFLQVVSDNTFRLLRIPAPASGTPDEIRKWIELITGSRLEEDRTLDALTMSEKEQRRGNFAASQSPIAWPPFDVNPEPLSSGPTSQPSAAESTSPLSTLNHAETQAVGKTVVRSRELAYLDETVGTHQSGKLRQQQAYLLARQPSLPAQLQATLGHALATTEPQKAARLYKAIDDDASLWMTGCGERVEFPHIPFNNGDGFTLEAWISDWDGVLVSQGDRKSLVAMANNSSASAKLGFGWHKGSDVAFWRSGFINDGRRHHWALVRDGDQLRIYFDGHLQVERQAMPPELDEKSPMWLGAAKEIVKRQGAGKIYQLRISSKVRYTQSAESPFTPTRELWESDEQTELLVNFAGKLPADATIRDLSKHKRHGRLAHAWWRLDELKETAWRPEVWSSASNSSQDSLRIDGILADQLTQWNGLITQDVALVQDAPLAELPQLHATLQKAGFPGH